MLFAKIRKLKKTQKCKTLAKFMAKAFKHTLWHPEVDKNMLVWDLKTWLAPMSEEIQRFLCLLLHFKSRA
jgi:hypothetical protein